MKDYPACLAENSRLDIPLLGNAAIDSHLEMIDDTNDVELTVGNELDPLFERPRKLVFEHAGARKQIFFVPGNVRAAVATCGGICPGLNDVVRSLVRTLLNAYKARSVIGYRYGLCGCVASYGLSPMVLTSETVNGIDDVGGTVLGTSRGPQKPDEIIATLLRDQIDMLFLIGGDGTLRAAHALSLALQERKLPIAVVGIPKTIDNDINFVPRSFGFETAVERTSDALRCAHVEARSVRGGVGIVKIMGRESGFIASHATLAYRNVDFTLIPEVPFAIDGPQGLLAQVEATLRRNGHVLLAVAEGAGQKYLPQVTKEDASGNRKPGDIAAHLMGRMASHLADKGLRHSFKYIDPSYMVRSVPACASDKIYAAALGQHAVHAAMSGRTGMVVAEIMDKFVHLPLELVSQKRRTLAQNGLLWRSVLDCTQQKISPADAPVPAE